MANGLIEGLRAAGREVIDIGLAPTPLCYFAAFQLRTGSCVAVTGSHNPPDYNGFKIVLGGETLAGDAIQGLYARIAEDRLFKSNAPGGLQQREIASDYIQRVAEDVQLERKLKVVVDCGNGVAGMIAPEVLEAIGCEVLPIFCEVDGTFPNHHPDPSEPKNLSDAIKMVQRMNADIGLAFDGDGDRLGVVTAAGEIIYPDRLLMLFASDVLERNPGACIVYDVKCTGHLAGHILRHGGSPLMWKTGHSLIKAKMKETGAELAGEMSGHFFFKERWYGFDDGIYAAARLLEILATRDENADAVFAELPKGFFHTRAQGDAGRRRDLCVHRQVPRTGEVRGRAGRHDRRCARGLARWLGTGACIQHNPCAGDALRCRHACRAAAHPGRISRTVARDESGYRAALLKSRRAATPASRC